LHNPHISRPSTCLMSLHTQSTELVPFCHILVTGTYLWLKSTYFFQLEKLWEPSTLMCFPDAILFSDQWLYHKLWLVLWISPFLDSAKTRKRFWHLIVLWKPWRKKLALRITRNPWLSSNLSNPHKNKLKEYSFYLQLWHFCKGI